MIVNNETAGPVLDLDSMVDVSALDDSDDIDLDATMDDVFGDMAIVDDPEPLAESVAFESTDDDEAPAVLGNETRSKKRKRAAMPFRDYTDKVTLVDAPDTLVSTNERSGYMQPLRFPIALMSVGQSFVVDSDIKSNMRKALRADINKLRKKVPGHRAWRFRVMLDPVSNQTYCVRLA